MSKVRALREVRAAAKLTTRSKEKRDMYIRQAVRAGATMQEVADVADLSRSRIHQIVSES